MASSARRRRAALLVLALAVVVAAPFLLRALLWWWESNPVLRGRLLAERQGCFACHGASAREVPNPGSRWGSVPRLGAGNALMYAPSREAIDEVIRLGAPRAWLDDPQVVARLERQRIRMPAFGGRLSARSLADLVAWAAAIEGLGLPGDEEAAAGRELARQHGCLSCHGVEGAGGLPNPGSLGGFIPGFAGRNFLDLVAGEAEFQEWVKRGRSRRLEANPLVRFFQRRQAVQMPAYGEALSDRELAQLWSWIGAVRRAAGADPLP